VVGIDHAKATVAELPSTKRGPAAAAAAQLHRFLNPYLREHKNTYGVAMLSESHDGALLGAGVPRAHFFRS
jgi:hypothetical protein